MGVQHVVHPHSDIDRAVVRVAARLTRLRENVKDRVLVARPSGLVVHTRLQAIFNLKFDDRVEQAIHEIVVTHAHSAERLGPGGFDACIERVLEKFDVTAGSNTNPAALVKMSDIVGGGASVPVRSDVDWVLAEHLAGADERTQVMLHRALDLAGFAGRIAVDKARARPSVELVRGYTFDLAPAWPINARCERPRIVCIDGFIEAVSELHHLLEEAAESKETVLLFVRGLADDVRNTLRVNYDRGSLRVVPIIAKFDIEGINVLNDVAIASGAHLVSSHTGELISATKLSEAVRIDEAVVYPTKVALTNTASRMSVEAHVAFLRKKRLDEKVDDVARLFDARVKALSPNHVIVRLPDDKNYVASAQAIDYALRAIRALIEHGTVEFRGKRMLTVTALASVVHADRCYETLRSLGALVTT